MINKVIHYNVLPRGAEKIPGKEKIALLYEFMASTRMNIALMIWVVIKDYAKATKLRVNLPNAHLVTKIC